MGDWAMGWLSRAELAALGWTLLHFCWQGTAVALLFALVDRMTVRSASRVRYAVAVGAMLLMPMMVSATFFVEMQASAPESALTTASHVYGVEPHTTIAQPVSALAGMSHTGTTLAMRAGQLLPWVDAAWLMGVLILSLRALGGWIYLNRLRRQARGVIPAHLQQSFQRVLARIHVGRLVMLRISDEVISPLAMGVWRATIILPASALLRLSSEELEAVLAHELGHIRRWDYVCNLIQIAVESVLFFHPAVWWVSRAVRDRREVCCDEIAVASCADAVVYAHALLRLEEQKVAELRFATALAGQRGSLLGRIEKVLGEDRPMVSGMTGGVRVMVAGAVVAGLLLGPKVGDAVAASRPMVQQVVALLPNAVSAAVTQNAHQTDTVKKMEHHTVKAVPATAVNAESAPEQIASLRLSEQAAAISMMAQVDAKPASKGISYIDGMRDAGYPLDLNNDLNVLVSLKSLGVTPEYAKQMGALGLGKPTVHELISLKSLGVTPEYVAGLKQSGIGPKDFHQVVTEKALGITPEYAAAMRKAGLGDMELQDLISLKAQGMTPEYASWLKQEFPQATISDLRRAAVFHLDDKFVAAAKAHGIDGKDLDKLLRLKMSGLLDE